MVRVSNGGWGVSPGSVHLAPPTAAPVVPLPNERGFAGAVELIRIVERGRDSGRARERCDEFDRTCDPARPLRYDEYLERQNRAEADVRPGLLPGERGADRAGVTEGRNGGERGGARGAVGAGRPSYAMARLGEIPPVERAERVRREEVVHRIEMFDPAGNVIDVFA